MWKQKRVLVSLIGSLVLGLVMVSLLGADKSGPETIMKKSRVTITKVLQTEAGVLEPGNYRVFCEHNGSEHWMVFVRNGRSSYLDPYHGGTRSSGRSGEVLKIPCRMKPLNEKVSRSFIHTRLDESGTRHLVRVGIKGERVEHIF